MAARDQLLQELLTEIKRKPITFENGIINSKNDSIPGFVSDLVNMEIGTENIAQRREGTRLISDKDNIKAWTVVKGVDFGGIPAAIAIDYKRRVYIFFKMWPEIQFSLRDTGPSKDFFYFNDSEEKIHTNQVMFSRGDNFFINSTATFIDITNDFGDTFRIDSLNYLRLDLAKEPTERIPVQDLDYSRYHRDDFPNLSAYVAVKDMRLPVIDRLNFAASDKDVSPRINGLLRVGAVNDMGVIGEMSLESDVGLPKSGYLSPFSMINLENNELKLKYNSITKVSGSAGDNDFFANYDGTGWHTALTSNPNYSEDDVYEGILIAIESEDDILYSGDIFGGTGLPESPGVYMFSPTATLYNGNYSEDILFRFDKNASLFGTNYISGCEAMSIDSLNPDILYRSITGPVASIEDASYTTSNPIKFADSFSEITWAVENDAVKVVVPYHPANTGTMNMCKLNNISPEYFKKSKAEFYIEANATTVVRCYGTIAKVYFIMASNPPTIQPAEIELAFKKDRLAHPVIPAKHLGYNNWEFESQIYLFGSDMTDNSLLVDIKPNEGIFEFDLDPIPTILLDNVNGYVTDYMTYGTRFAVFNKDVDNNQNILLISQRGYQRGNPLSPANTPIYEPSTNSDIKDSVPIEEFSKFYSPVASLEGISLSRYSFDFDPNITNMKGPRQVKYSNGKLYYLEGTRLYSGNINSLLANSTVNVSARVIKIEEFYGNLAVGTNKGLFVYDGVKLKKVNGGEGVIVSQMTSGKDGIYIIDANNKLWLLYSYRTGDANVEGFAVTSAHDFAGEIDFNKEIIMQSAGKSIYIASGNVVHKVDTLESNKNKFIRWSGKYEFENDVKLMFNFAEKLGIVFEEDQDLLWSYFEEEPGEIL